MSNSDFSMHVDLVNHLSSEPTQKQMGCNDHDILTHGLDRFDALHRQLSEK